MSRFSQDAEIFKYSIYFYNLLNSLDSKLVSYEQIFSQKTPTIVNDNIILHTDIILTELVKYMPEILAICERIPETLTQIDNFADYLVGEYGYDSTDYTDNISKYGISLIDVHMDRVLPEIYNTMHTFFTHYIDFLIHIGEINTASELFISQIHKWSRGASYACQFVSRYSRSYNDISDKVSLLPELFRSQLSKNHMITHDTKLYMQLVANCDSVHQYLATNLVVLSLSNIPNICPLIVNKYFPILTMRCLDQENAADLIRLLYDCKDKDNTLILARVLESYSDTEVDKKIRAHIKSINKK